MKYNLSLSVCMLAFLTSCSSTKPQQSPPVQPKKSMLTYDYPNSNSFEEFHLQLAEQLGVTVEEKSSIYGNFKVIKTNELDGYGPIGRWDIESNLFRAMKNSCSSFFSNHEDIEIPYIQGKFNPYLYGVNDNQLEFLKKYIPGSGVLYKDLDTGERISTLGEHIFYRGKGYDGINTYTYKLLGRKRGLFLGTRATYSCLDGGKFKESIAFSTGADKNLYVIYISEPFLDMAIQSHLNDALEYAKTETKAKRDLKEKERQEFIKKNQDYFDAKARAEKLWENRLDNAYTIGQGICSYDNKMGFVEQLSGDRVKVMWKGKLVKSSAGYFFGGKSLYDGNDFNYEPLTNITWVSKSDISYCHVNL
ncbi:hypothetical protein [Thalassotalea maritima]|uniref:hypothetical protein n=1 Tax=Thalassotalea maritima TaxID=3242416 RepID=UPI0035290D8B